MTPVLPLRRRVVAALTVLATVTVLGHPALADDGGDDRNNNVVVINRVDDVWRSRARASVPHTDGRTVNNENVAYAYASCTDCRTVAAAVQVVIVEGPVTDFRPGNAAVAVNESCIRCQTFAYARQEVLSADRRVWISDAAEGQIAGIQRQLRAVAASDASFDDMLVQLDSLTDQLVSVLQGEVERAGTWAGHEKSERQVDRKDD